MGSSFEIRERALREAVQVPPSAEAPASAGQPVHVVLEKGLDVCEQLVTDGSHVKAHSP
jgi:hypothetical protein